MLRLIFATAAGLLAAVVAIAAVQALNFALNPPPPELDLEDPAVIATILWHIGPVALVTLEASYVLGSTVGGLTAALVSEPGDRRTSLVGAGVVGVVLTGLDVLNLMSLPHPWWLAMLTLLTFIPCTLLGAHIGHRLRSGA